MHILGLELENVKSYEKSSITFTEGVNAIVGHNGAGKSTILEAIGFVLFDTLQYNQREFLREGARSARATVTFLSSFDDRAYRVERRFGGSNSHIVFDNELGMKICEGKADVLQFMREHTGAEPTTDLGRLFTDALGVPQGTLTAAFLLSPAQRKSTFDPLLQVDEYRTAVDRLREPRRLLQEAQQTNAVRIADLAARLERLPALEDAITQRKDEISTAEKTLATLQSQLSLVGKQRATLDAVQKQIDQLTGAAASNQWEVDTLLQQQSVAEQSLQEAQTARKIVSDNQPGHAKYLRAQEQKKELEDQQRLRQDLLGQRAVIDKSIALITSEMQRLVADLARIEEATATVEKLAGAVTEQAALEETLTSAEQKLRRLEELGQQVERQERSVADLRQREKTLLSGLALIDSTQNDLTELQGQIAGLQQQIEDSRAEQVTFQTEAESLKKQSDELADPSIATCPICEQPLSPAHRIKMLARNEERLLTLRTAFGQARKQLSESNNALKAKIAEQERLRQQLLALPRAAELDDLRGMLAGAETELTALNQERADLASVPEQITEIRARLERLGNPRERNTLAAQKAGRLAETEQAYAATEADLARARQQLSEIDAGLSAYAALDEQLLAVDREVMQHLEAYQAVLTYGQQAQTVETRREMLDALSARLEQAKIKLHEEREKLTTLEHRFDQQVYTSILSQERTLRGESGGLETKLTMLRRDQDRDHAEVSMLHQRADELAAVQTDQKELGIQQSVLESVRSLLRQAGPHITRALITQISSGAAHIFSELMHDFSRHLRWNEDYGITLEVDGVERAFAQLSGGEQMSAALAVRLALVREMSSINIAFFDEPTANLDDTRREALAQQILTVKGFGQIFVISHDDTFEQVTQNLIRVRRNGNTSTVAGT